MVITNKWIALNSSHPCGTGWTLAQLKSLGIRWPPPKGWRLELIGQPISDTSARTFEKLGQKRRRRHEARRLAKREAERLKVKRGPVG